MLCGQVSNAIAGQCPGKDSKQLVLQRLERFAFARLEHWSGLPFPPPGDLPDPGIEPTSLALAGGYFTTEPPGKLWGPTGECISTVAPPGGSEGHQ